jgi:hypothetical protein
MLSAVIEMWVLTSISERTQLRDACTYKLVRTVVYIQLDRSIEWTDLMTYRK